MDKLDYYVRLPEKPPPPPSRRWMRDNTNDVDNQQQDRWRRRGSSPLTTTSWSSGCHNERTSTVVVAEGQQQKNLVKLSKLKMMSLPVTSWRRHHRVMSLPTTLFLLPTLLVLLLLDVVLVVHGVQLKLNENFLCDINENTLYCDSAGYQFMPFFMERKFAHNRIDKLWLRCNNSGSSSSGSSPWSVASFVRENKKFTVIDYNSYITKRDLHELHIVECPIEEQPLSQLVEILFNYNDQFRLKVLNVSGIRENVSADPSYSSSIEQLDHFLRKNEAILRNLHVLEVANVQYIATATEAAIELVHLKHLRKLKLINVTAAASSSGSRGSSKSARTSVSTSINTSVRRPSDKRTADDRGLVRLNSNLLELVLRNNSLMTATTTTTTTLGACGTMLRNLSNLEQLDLSQNALSADQVENCFQLDDDDDIGDATSAAASSAGVDSEKRDALRLRRFDKLKVLHLDHNRINFRTHKRLFSGDALKHLEVLALDRNDIDEVQETTFSGLTSLLVLTLTGNKLTVIGPHAFRPLIALRQLAIDTNRLTSIAPLFSALTTGTGKSKTNQLLDLNLNGNELTEIPAAIENSLVRLKSLDLGSNRIVTINGQRFAGLTDLLGLRLVDNLLTRVTKMAFHLLTSLQIINLSANKITAIESDAFQFNQQLQIVRLDQNQLNMLPKNCFKSLGSLLWLNLSNNALNKFYMNELPNSVELLDLHSNKIYEIKNMKGPDYLDNLRYLDLAHNHLPLLNEETIPNGLVEISVEDNFITFIEINTFANKNRLTRINLRNNLMTRLESKLFFHKINQNHDLELLLAQNPFDCDCSLEWLMILQEQPQNLQIIDLEEIACTSPIQRRRLTRLIEDTSSGSGRRNGGNNRAADRVHSEPFNSSELKANIRQLIDHSSTRIVEEHQQFLCKYENHCFTLCQCCEYEATCDCYMKCPADCNCYYETTWQTNVVDCGQSNLTAVPTRIPFDATILYLDGNDFHRRIVLEGSGGGGGNVAADENGNQLANYRRQQSHHHLFLGRNKLAVLFLNHSQVVNVSNASLYGLGHLRELHLEHNRIVRLAEGNEFEHVPKLERLYLHDNRIEYIDTDTFRALSHLQVLTLRRNAFGRQEPFKFLVPSALSLFIINGVLADLHVGNEFNCEFNCNEMEEAFQLDDINRRPSEPAVVAAAAAELSARRVSGGRNVTKHFLLEKFFRSKRANALKCAGDRATLVIPAFIERCEFIKEANQQLRLVNKSAAQGAQDAAFKEYLRKHYLWPGAEFLPVFAVTATTILFLALCLILASVFRQQIQLMVFTRCGVRLGRRSGGGIHGNSSGAAVGGAQLTLRRQSNGQLDLEPLCDAWVLCNERDYAYIESFVVDVMDQMGYYMQITSDWEQLPSSVEMAQRTMLVISSGFLEKEWQNVAFRQALYSMIGRVESRGSIARRLIVVVAVPTELLIADGQLLKLIRSATMVQLGEKRFWDKVRYAMPDVVMPIGSSISGGNANNNAGNGPSGFSAANEANRNNWRRKLKRYAAEESGNEVEEQHPPPLPPKPSSVADRSPHEYDVMAVGGGSSSERSGSTALVTTARGSCVESGASGAGGEEDELDRDQLSGTMGNVNLHNPKMVTAARNSREATMVNGIDNEQLQKIQLPRYNSQQTTSRGAGGRQAKQQHQKHYHQPAGSGSQQAYFV